MNYIELHRAAVPPDTVRMAEAAVDYASTLLHVPRPRIRWFAPGEARGAGWDTRSDIDLGVLERDLGDLALGGFVRPEALDELWLRTDLRRGDVLLSALHEIVHVLQGWGGLLASPSLQDELERQADSWSRAVMGALGWSMERKTL